MAAAPCLYFKDLLRGHPKQLEFLQDIQTHRLTFLFGANQSGKTTVGKAMALAAALGYRFWEVPSLRLTDGGDLPPRNLIPMTHWVRRADGLPVKVPNLGVVISGLKRGIGIGENIWPALRAFVPESWRAERLPFKAVRGPLGTPENLTLPNGSRILFLSEEQEDWAFEGFVADWAWVDEPVRQAIFNALQARLMANSGRLWFTLTPLGARSAWMLPYLDGGRADSRALTVTQKDNPGLTDEQRRIFEDNPNWTSREKRARLYGEFEVLGDRVFDTFDPHVHVVPARALSRAGLIHGMTVDPHHRKPAYMVWWAFEPSTKSYHFYREWPSDRDFFRCTDGGLSPPGYASLIRGVEARLPAAYRVCDPRFGKSEHTTHGVKSTAWVESMAELGLRFSADVPNVGTIEFGHNVIIDLLHHDPNFPISPTNCPRLTISSECKNLIKAFQMYGYLDVKDPIKGLFRKVSEEFKDPIDAVRYTVLWPIPATPEQVDRMQHVTPELLAAENYET